MINDGAGDTPGSGSSFALSLDAAVNISEYEFIRRTVVIIMPVLLKTQGIIKTTSRIRYKFIQLLRTHFLKNQHTSKRPTIKTIRQGVLLLTEFVFNQTNIHYTFTTNHAVPYNNYKTDHSYQKEMKPRRQ